MNIAICYFGTCGYSKGKSGNGELIKSKSLLDNNFHYLIKPNHADVYVHSWSIEYESFFVESLKPVDFIF